MVGMMGELSNFLQEFLVDSSGKDWHPFWGEYLVFDILEEILMISIENRGNDKHENTIS